MPDGALSEDLLNYRLVEKYIAKNAKSWYEYVESDDCGMPTENGDIRVVVGMDKVTSWGMATFQNPNVKEPLRFEFKDDGSGSQPRTYKWDRIIGGRAGPPEEETRDLLQGPNASSLRNQCVFVRTLNISVAGKVRDELAVYEVLPSCFRNRVLDSPSGRPNVNSSTPQTVSPPSLSSFSRQYFHHQGPTSIKFNKQVFVRKGFENFKFKFRYAHVQPVSQRGSRYHQGFRLDISYHRGAQYDSGYSFSC